MKEVRIKVSVLCIKLQVVRTSYFYNFSAFQIFVSNRRSNLLSLNDFKTHSILKHLLYWVGLVAFFSMAWGSSDNNYQRNLVIQLFSLPSRLILVYTTLGFLIPSFLLKRQFLRFSLSYLCLLTIIGLLIQRPLMLYYIQPVYLPEWSASNFFTISELTNTLLDVNLAAILPIGYTVYKHWDKSYKNEREQAIQTAFIYLKVEKRLEKVALDDIIFIESLKNYIKVKTSKKEIVAYKSLTAMQESLPKDKFLRVHRSFIIATPFVEAFSPNQISLGSINIPIGRKYKEEVKKRLGYF